MMMTEIPPARPRFAPLVDQDGAPVPPALRYPPEESGWAESETAPATGVPTLDGPLLRGLAMKVLAAGVAGLVKAGIAAVQHGEGATMVARSLGACLTSQFGRRVVLVEANARSPSLRAACGLPAGPGLGDVLSGAASLEMTLRAARAAGKMVVLPAGGALPRGETLVRGMQQVAAELFQYADTLLFDLPPLLACPEAASMGRALDGVALVLRARRTTRADAAQAVELLTAARVSVLGAVLNRERRGR